MKFLCISSLKDNVCTKNRRKRNGLCDERINSELCEDEKIFFTCMRTQGNSALLYVCL